MTAQLYDIARERAKRRQPLVWPWSIWFWWL